MWLCRILRLVVAVGVVPMLVLEAEQADFKRAR
jgi:hypothetical protein